MNSVMNKVQMIEGVVLLTHVHTSFSYQTVSVMCLSLFPSMHQCSWVTLRNTSRHTTDGYSRPLTAQ